MSAHYIRENDLLKPFTDMIRRKLQCKQYSDFSRWYTPEETTELIQTGPLK